MFEGRGGVGARLRTFLEDVSGRGCGGHPGLGGKELSLGKRRKTVCGRGLGGCWGGWLVGGGETFFTTSILSGTGTDRGGRGGGRRGSFFSMCILTGVGRRGGRGGGGGGMRSSCKTQIFLSCFFSSEFTLTLQWRGTSLPSLSTWENGGVGGAGGLELQPLPLTACGTGGGGGGRPPCWTLIWSGRLS